MNMTIEKVYELAKQRNELYAALNAGLLEHFPKGTKVIIHGNIPGVVNSVDAESGQIGAILEHGYVRWFALGDVVLAPPQPGE